jgi:hypothetical protein
MSRIAMRLLVVTLFISLAIPLFAHQPNYVAKRTRIVDAEPSISKAYYGELDGQGAVYQISSESTFELYLNILSPYADEAFRDFSVLVEDNKGAVIGMLNDPLVDWTRWFEEFAGDWYWQGPELKMQLPPGRYVIIVQNPTRSGKYVLAIGEDESFPLREMLQTLKELYWVKTRFFDEPWYGIYRGIVGRYLMYTSLAISIVILVVAGMVVWVVRKGIRQSSITSR